MKAANTSPTLAAALAAAALTGGLLVAGPLNPPGGPVASTYKTLADVEPRTALSPSTTPGNATTTYIITQPGSYYLTANVDAPAGGTGIVVSASDVVLDLNGFKVSAAGGTGAIGIRSTSRVAVRNGSVVSDGFGVDLFGSHCRAEDLTVTSGALVALRVGLRGSVDRCTVASDGTIAVQAGNYGRITDCIVAGGTGTGYSVNPGGYVSGCTASGSGTGFYLDLGSTAENCTAAACSADGFFLNRSIARSCIARNSVSDGFESSGRSIIESCLAESNTTAGFRMNGNGTLRNSVANNNNVGFRSETGIGLQIIENEFSNNSSYGIFSNGMTNARIDGNHIYGNNAAPIFISGSGGHLIVRNTFKNNNGAFPTDPSSDIAQVLTNPGNAFSSSNAWANIAY